MVPFTEHTEKCIYMQYFFHLNPPHNQKSSLFQFIEKLIIHVTHWNEEKAKGNRK